MRRDDATICDTHSHDIHKFVSLSRTTATIAKIDSTSWPTYSLARPAPTPI